MRTVIFDLDGTLADTSADLIAAANACFRTLGHGDMLDAAQDAATAFRGGRAMLRLGFERLGTAEPAPLVEAQYPQLLEAYRGAIATHTTLYPGVRAAVAGLQRAGFRLGICTNKPAALAEALMQDLDFRSPFAALVGADTLPVRKPDPAPLLETVRRVGGDPRRALLVGDTVTDRDTARAAGMPVVLVGFGPEGRTVERLAPDALLEHYDALQEMVERLL